MSPVRSNVYILAGGGSGGHLFPGLAVADQLRRLDPAARILFTCSSRGIDRTILDPTPYGVVPQSVLPTPRRRRHWPAFVRPGAGAPMAIEAAVIRTMAIWVGAEVTCRAPASGGVVSVASCVREECARQTPLSSRDGHDIGRSRGRLYHDRGQGIDMAFCSEGSAELRRDGSVVSQKLAR